MVPEGLRLHITVKLADNDLGYNFAHCMNKHNNRHPDKDPKVIWRLETRDDWVFLMPEPEDVTMGTMTSDNLKPKPCYEVQYGLKHFPWQTTGSLVVHVLRFHAVIQGIMKDLGYPDRKINEFIDFWSSRLAPANPTYVEIKALSHPGATMASTIIVEKAEFHQEQKDSSYIVDITRMMLSFRPLHEDLCHDETPALRQAVLTKIRELAKHRFTLGTADRPSKNIKIVSIFEASGIVVDDSDKSQEHSAKTPAREGRRRSNDSKRPRSNSGSLEQSSAAMDWICCNPGNYNSHSKTAYSRETRTCWECGHPRCQYCMINGGMRKGSFGQIPHPENPMKIENQDNKDEVVTIV